MRVSRLLASRGVRTAAAGSIAALLVLSGWPAARAQVRATVSPPVPYIPAYTMYETGSLSGYDESGGVAINASGDVTGWLYSTYGDIYPAEQAFRNVGTVLTGLGALSDNDRAVGLSINASGEVVGASGDLVNFTNPYHAVSWTGTTLTDISGGVNSYADGINDAGDVVGFEEVSPGVSTAFRYHAAAMTDLNTLVTGGDTSLALHQALAISASGKIAGFGRAAGGPDRAFLFDAGTVTNLGVIGSHPADGTVATALNDAGEVVGFQTGVVNHPFLWDGSMHDLGSLPGFTSSSAWGINSTGWVVGEADKGSGASAVSHAFVRAPRGQLVDLNTRVELAPGDYLEGAFGINDAGQIVGQERSGNREYSFILTPSNVSRIFGATRYDTAAQISSQNYAIPQATVYIATGQNFPDALAGAALAGHQGAPLLLVPTDGALPASVQTELQRLTPTNIVIFGGPGAVSDAMLAQIQAAAGVTPSRIFGATRYDTAAQISSQNYAIPQATVYIATGQNFPDALAGAALAGHQGAPLLLVPTDGALPASVQTELQRLTPTNIVIFGGPGAVSDAMLAQIQAAAGVTPSRIFGATRYDTAAAIAAAGYGGHVATVDVATGLNFPDALAGAALAGHVGSPLLLVPAKGTLPASVQIELDDDLTPTNIVIFGGTGAVPTSIELQLAQY